MTVLDWIAVICLAVAILFLLFMLYFLLRFFQVRKEIKKLSSIRTKNKKKRKKLMQLKKKKQKNKKKGLVWIVVFLLVGVSSAAGSAYTIYYQSNNLGEADQKAIVNGYYYLRELEKQLEDGPAGEASKIKLNLGTLSSRLSAFALNKADYRISGEGQRDINRYYTSLKELGINLSAQEKEFYMKPEQLAEFQADLKKVKKNEKIVLKRFKVNEKALAQEK